MRDHYGNNFEWFLRAEDAMYLKPEKLLELLNCVNSSKDVYLGRPGSFRANGGNGDGDLYTHEKYCQGGAGVVLSRSALMKLVPRLDSCLQDALTEQEDVELGRCLYKNVGLQCTWSYEVRLMIKGTNSTGPLINISLNDSIKNEANEWPGIFYNLAVVYLCYHHYFSSSLLC